MFRKLLFGLLIVVLIVATVVLFNTFTFPSKQLQVESIEHEKVDEDAINRFAKALTFKTISWQDPEKFDSSAFRQFHDFLAAQFPMMDSLLEKQYINDLTLLYKWQGTNPNLKPVLLMAHQDVVPVDTAKLDLWDELPFAGKISNGFVYGRGAQDVKGQLMEIHEAAELLLEKGFQPERTIYFSFGHDEEIGGERGAKKVAEYFQQNNIEIEFMVDEGGAVLHEVMPGVTTPVAVVGIAEKGYVTFELTVNETGGHSSMPPRETAIGILSKAIANLENKPYPLEIKGATEKLLEYTGPEMDFPMNMAMANRWLFDGLITKKLAETNSARATLHTTTAATIFQAGTKENVLPTTATAIVNHRILPGHSIEYLKERNEKVIDDDRVKIEVHGGHDFTEASPVSDVNSESFEIMQKTISQVMPDAIVAPYLVVGGTDCKHFNGVAENIYRFQPTRMNSADLKRIHGNNERHEIENYKESINFFIQLIENSCSR